MTRFNIHIDISEFAQPGPRRHSGEGGGWGRAQLDALFLSLGFLFADRWEMNYSIHGGEYSVGL
jgi:hypothetical protein